MNKFCSIFSQLLHLFSRIEFQRAMREAKAERHAQASRAGANLWPCFFASWAARVHSLREITGGVRSYEGKLKELGITAPSRSTLPYGNKHRPLQLYQHLFVQLLDRCRSLIPTHLITQELPGPMPLKESTLSHFRTSAAIIIVI